ncbi:MAG: DUF5678 domain-containing protein [Nanoarchaeota archaeon]
MGIHQNYESFLKLDLSGYVGQWVAIHDDKVISNGPTAKHVYDDAQAKYPGQTPLVVNISDEGIYF